MELIEVGIFPLGRDSVRIFFREGNGGEFFINPGDGKIAEIVIGATEDWDDVLATVVHEAFEMVAEKALLRYQKIGDYGYDSASVTFIFSHSDFSHVCACVGSLLAASISELSKAFIKINNIKTEDVCETLIPVTAN